jgi:hypothetical protein
MNEPSRIGLTPSTDGQLDELLADLNPDPGMEGVKLIKFDLYRLAVSIGLKKEEVPPLLVEKSTSSLRISELDPDGVLCLAAESSGLLPADTSVYEFIERLAEHGIAEMCSAYQQTGQLPLEQYFGE